MPLYDELSAKVIYPKVKKYLPEIDEYLPAYNEDYVPPFKFFWGILCTLDHELAEKFVQHSIKLRENDKKKDESFSFSEEVYEQLLKATKKPHIKGKAFTILGSKNLADVKRKRKKKYSAMELKNDENEEAKDYRGLKRKKEYEREVDIDEMNVDNPRDMRQRSYSDIERQLTNEEAEYYLRSPRSQPK